MLTVESSSPVNGAAAPLASLARQVRGEAARTMWACLLEATAVKAGNVHPTAAFHDLNYRDFVAAGAAIAPVMAGPDEGIGAVTLAAVRATRQACRSNVNLGIILLLAPLRQAARQVSGAPGQTPQERLAILRKSLTDLLGSTTAEDGAEVFQAIREAQPGGMGEAEAMDVQTTTNVDLIAAMRAAADRDLIARQYARDFADLFDLVVPKLDDALHTEGDMLDAIRWGQVALLSALPDTLILRKLGAAEAEQTRQRAAAVGAIPAGQAREAAWQAFDSWLRSAGHQRNPGAIADLIAAGLWLLFYREERESMMSESSRPPSPDGACYRVDVAKEAFVFSAAHFITFAGDICERIHGHNYGVRVSVEGPLDVNRYVVDFIALRDAVLAETQRLDHHVILPRDHAEIAVASDDRETTARFRDRRWVFPNEDCVILPVVNTTAEEIARVIGERVIERTREAFGDGLATIEVAVDENCGQWGVCRLPWPTHRG